jgi:hypothetical protein
MLRFACLSFRTHPDTVVKFLKILELKTQLLKVESGYS